MPLIFVLRALFSLFSLVIIAGAAWLIWTWYRGEPVIDQLGNAYTLHEQWRLWVGLALAALSLGGGGLVLRPLLGGKGRHLSARHEAGKHIESTTGASLYVQRLGPPSAATIILTHGWGLDSTIWQYAKEDLGHRFQLVLWDLPGLGRSKAGKNGLSLSTLAADLEAVIRASRGNHVFLVGHSIGGMTIQTLAKERPAAFGNVAGVVLVNTTHTDPLKTMILPRLMQALRFPIIQPAMYLTKWLLPLSWLSAWQSYLSGTAHLANRLGFGKRVSGAQLEHTVLVQTRNSPAVQADGNLAMFDWDATDTLPDFPVPLLILAGSLDIVTKPEASRTISELVPGSRLQVIEGSNHMGFLENPEAYNQAIGDFVGAITGLRTEANRSTPAHSKR
jgi:pimeloyl-ACP methyl ester carboxylesterase